MMNWTFVSRTKVDNTCDGLRPVYHTGHLASRGSICDSRYLSVCSCAWQIKLVIAIAIAHYNVLTSTGIENGTGLGAYENFSHALLANFVLAPSKSWLAPD